MTMSDSDAKPDLKQLIEDANQGVVQQQATDAARANQRPAQSNIKNGFGYLLLAGLLVVAFLQYPRIHAPYVWPDIDSSSTAAEADLEAVVGVIETYRLSQGQYPATLGQVNFPEGLAHRMESSKLDYVPGDNGYTLAWALPNWVARYSSAAGKISVEPKAKN